MVHIRKRASVDQVVGRESMVQIERGPLMNPLVVEQFLTRQYVVEKGSMIHQMVKEALMLQCVEERSSTQTVEQRVLL